MHNFKISEYISDAILIVEKKNFEIKYVNYEFENLIKKSKTKIIGKKLEDIFKKSSIIYDCIIDSKKKVGKLIFDDLHFNIFKNQIKSKLEIINSDDKNLVIFFKTENNKFKKREQNTQNFLYLNNSISNVVDKIRNPLSNIRGSVYLLKKNKNTDLEMLKIIDEEANKIFNLLNFIEYEKFPTARLSKNNIHEILRDIINQFEFEKRKKVIEKFDPSIPDFYFNKTEIQKAINLLVQNSINIIDEIKGFIEIETSFSFGFEKKISHISEKKKQNFLSIKVRDNQSLANQNINDIFLPFYANNPEERGYNFYLLKKIIIENEGDVWVELENGIVQYIITLPIYNGK